MKPKIHGMSMVTEYLDLEEVERRARRSTVSDDLWDLYLGWLLIALGIPLFSYRPG